MNINCYINFNGNCKEALHFYETVFHTQAEIMTYADMPDSGVDLADEQIKKLVMHGQLDIHNNRIMFSDVLPDMQFIQGNNISISLSGEDEKELTAWYQGLSDGGEIVMSLEHTFWSELYGLVIDRFGIHWHVNKAKK